MKQARAWLKANRRKILTWTAVVVIIILLASLATSKKVTETAFDPSSAKPDGTKAFVLLMKQAGATFSVGDKPTSGTAVLLQDNLSSSEAQNVSDWVQAGGTLVVADPRSSLTQGVVGTSDAQPTAIAPKCDSNFAHGVVSIRPNSNADYTLFERGEATEACFPVKKNFFMVVNQVGRGKIVNIGSPDLFMNQDLANQDNAVFVTDLLQPKSGTDIVLLQPTNVAGDGTGDESRSGGSSAKHLIPDSARKAIVQLIVASCVLMLWRSRRLGKPVDEEQLVEIPGSQLVTATGRLLETANQTHMAASMMRADLKRSLTQLLGVDAAIRDDALIQILHDRTNIDANRLNAVLTGMPAADKTQLVRLSQEIERLYTEVSSVR